MAKIGLQYPVYKTWDDTPKTGVIGEAIQANISLNFAEAMLYADDKMAEFERSFQNGELTLETSDLPVTAQIDLLGHKQSEDGELIANIDDAPPYAGFGFFGTSKANGERKYRAVWLPKVQFNVPNDENSTKGESISFGTPTMTAKIMADDDGNWKKEQTFDTAAEAKNYLNNKKDATSAEAQLQRIAKKGEK